MHPLITIFAIIGILCLIFIVGIITFILVLAIKTTMKVRKTRTEIEKLQKEDPAAFEKFKNEAPTYDKFKELFNPKGGCCGDKK